MVYKSVENVLNLLKVEHVCYLWWDKTRQKQNEIEDFLAEDF